MSVQHVLIIGNGLAGPALALGLAKHGIRSSVFEIRPTASTAGSSISLAPNALRALDKTIGVYDKLKPLGYSYDKLEMHTDDGALIGSVLQSDQDYQALRIQRSTLQKGLIDGCLELPNLVSFTYGVKLSMIEETASGVTAHFEDGSSASGDILIGADGIHSAVRSHVVANAPKSTFTGTCLISGTVELSSIKIPADWTHPSIIITPIGMISIFPHSNDGKEAAWSISEDLPEKDRDGWREYEVSGEAAKAAKSHYQDVKDEPIRSLLDGVKDEEVKLWAPYSIPDIDTWHKGRVLLIGDAAHALPPNGQGVAMAFEDAAFLIQLLAIPHNHDKGIEAVYTHFEANRRARISKVRRLGHGLSPTKKGAPSQWQWLIKKWVMFAFFWWKGGVFKDERISCYDVTQQDVKVV